MTRCAKNALAIAAALTAVVAVAAGIARQNVSIDVTDYKYKSKKVSSELSGFKIAHISDLHNRRFGDENAYLIDKIKACEPDIIVISGDLLDSRHTDIEAAVEFAASASEIAPVYYTTGNHEQRFSQSELSYFLDRLRNAGVIVLEDEAVELSNGMRLVGLSDKSVGTDVLPKLLSQGSHEELTLLISHKPHYAQWYADCGADLTFCGHAHGGQVIIPFVGGLIAPDQGLFPKLTQGLHYYGNSATVISRGLGNSLIPIRINNPPELVIVTLESLPE